MNRRTFLKTLAGVIAAAALPMPTPAPTFALQELHGVVDVSWKLLKDAKASDLTFNGAIWQIEEHMHRNMVYALNKDLYSQFNPGTHFANARSRPDAEIEADRSRIVGLDVDERSGENRWPVRVVAAVDYRADRSLRPLAGLI